MIKKTLHLFIIIAFLVGVCIWEEVSISLYLGEIDTAIISLQSQIIDQENVDTNALLFEVENLEEIWRQKEDKFCVIINHQDVEVIGVEISRLKASVVNNDIKEFNLSLSVIKFYIENLSNILGLSIQNLI